MKEEDRDDAPLRKTFRWPFSSWFVRTGPVPEEHKNSLIRPFPYNLPEAKDKDDLAWDRYERKRIKKRNLTKKARDDYLKKRFGREKIVKGHPQMWAIHEFVESVQALGVEKAPRVRKSCQEEKEKYRDELLEYIGAALENLDWEGLQGLGRIFEMAVTGEGEMPYEASDLVKAGQVMSRYYIGHLIGFPAGVKIKSSGPALPPTRKDLEQFLAETDRQRIEQIVRAAKALGYTIRPRKPGVPPR